MYRALIPASQVPDCPDRNSVVLWLCNGGHVVQYPLTGGRLNFVAVHESGQHLDGWNTTAKNGEVGLLFQSVCSQLGDQLSRVENWLKWIGADLDPSPDWGSGNITMVGDAAHATLPYLAQGAAMALEDAVTLAHQMGDAANDPAQSLRRYEALRQPRTKRIILESRKMERLIISVALAPGCGIW